MNKEFTVEMVKRVLNFLSDKDHFFVSEAHLQTEFIIAAAKLFPDYKYYPEFVPADEDIPSKYIEKRNKKGTHFDLLIKTYNQRVLIEFKYITDNYQETMDASKIIVKSHMAMDIRRYDSWSDIERIELFSIDKESYIDYGYFILVTNVPALWNNPGRNSLDAEFHIEEGIHKAGIRKWKDGASKGTIRNRERPIETISDYYFSYNDFYDSKKKKGCFKSLIVEINDEPSRINIINQIPNSIVDESKKYIPKHNIDVIDDSFMPSRVVVFNVGYMKYYKGKTKDDHLQTGGSFVQREGWGGEECNFLVHDDGYLYGFVETKYKDGQVANVKYAKELHIEKIASYVKKINSIDDVLVIFIAKQPYKPGNVIVGWYDNATVYRYRELRDDCTLGYHAKCKAENAHLIPESKRFFVIDKFGANGEPRFGQSYVWYIGNKPQHRKLLKEIITYLNEIK